MTLAPISSTYDPFALSSLSAGMMRLLAARKLGMLHPPPMPDAPAPHLAAVQLAAQGPVPQHKQGGLPSTSQPLPPQGLSALGGGDQQAGGGGGGEQSPDMQRLLGLLAQGLAAAGMLPGQSPKNGAGRLAAPAAAAAAAQSGPPGKSAPLPPAHNPRMGKLFSAPAHHSSAANPVPAISRVPERAGRGGSEQGGKPKGPMPFSAPRAPNLFPGFGSASAPPPPPGAGAASGSEPQHGASSKVGAVQQQEPQLEHAAGGSFGGFPSLPPPTQHPLQQQPVSASRPGSGGLIGQAEQGGAQTRGGLSPEVEAALRLLAALQQQGR